MARALRAKMLWARCLKHSATPKSARRRRPVLHYV